jgi:integral membrane protein
MLADLLKTVLGRLRFVAFLEGSSLLVLIGIAMPLKYLVGYPQPVRMVGMAHGVLFILYVVLLIQVTVEYNWGWKKFILAFLASVIPFGTFYADRKIFRHPN